MMKPIYNRANIESCQLDMGEYTDLDLSWKWIGANFKANINMKDGSLFSLF